MCKCGVVNRRMHGQWCLQIIYTYRWNGYLGHVIDSLGEQNKNI